jgi:hypothetical protein
LLVPQWVFRLLEPARAMERVRALCFTKTPQ